MKRFYLLFLIALLGGCATLGTEITGRNNHIQMPHYSFFVPGDEGWHIQRQDKHYEKAVINKEEGSVLFSMQFLRNIIIDEGMRANPAEVVADDYRGFERRSMIELGVKKGLYQLKDVRTGKKKVGNKIFYTMDYTILSKQGTQKASLYLYFPKERNNYYFIIAHYSETIPPGASLAKSYKPDFLATLESLEVK